MLYFFLFCCINSASYEATKNYISEARQALPGLLEKIAADRLLERLDAGERCDMLCYEADLLIETARLNKEYEEWQEVKAKYKPQTDTDNDLKSLQDEIDALIISAEVLPRRRNLRKLRREFEKMKKEFVREAKDRIWPKLRRIPAIADNLSESGSSTPSASSSSPSRISTPSFGEISSTTTIMLYEDQHESAGRILEMLITRLRAAPVSATQEILLTALNRMARGLREDGLKLIYKDL